MAYGYGLKPFWFWNGDMRDDEIRLQIQEMYDKGIDGFFIHPRQGLEIPYLSKLWFDKVGVAVEYAEKLGIEVWLYDEFAYPSGIAGGEVINGHPEYEAASLKIVSQDFNGEVKYQFPWGKILNICACPIKAGKVCFDEKIDLREFVGTVYTNKIYQDAPMFYNKKRYFSSDFAWELNWFAESDYRIYACIEMKVKDFKYFGTFIDPINPKVIDSFIEFTHEKYKKYLGQHFGKTIKGIFSDETAPWGGNLAWSPLMPELFAEAKNYPLCEYLPALIDDIGEKTNQIRFDYNEVITNAFIENFDKKLNDWCIANNLVYTGEKPILRSNQLKYTGIPGIDTGHEKAGDTPPVSSLMYRASGKVASSAAHFYNKPRTLVEAYHSEGWDLSILDMKWNIDILGSCGVDMYVPHGFYYSTDGLRKHDAPPSMFYQMPYWKYMGQLSDYMKNLFENLQGQRIVNVLVLDPTAAFWSAKNHEAHIESRKKFAGLQRQLMFNQIDYYTIDTDLLYASETNGNQILINGEAFDALIIPSLDAVKYYEGLAEIIQKYSEAGGKIIVNENQSITSVLTNAKYFDNSSVLCGFIKKEVVLECSVESEKAENLLLTHYKNETGDVIFLVNTSKDEFGLKLRLADAQEIDVYLKPFESNLFKYQNGNWYKISSYGEKLYTGLCSRHRIELPHEQPWSIKLHNKNALRLYEWKLSLLNDKQSENQGFYLGNYNALVPTKPIINQVLDSKIPVAPNLISSFGCSPRLGFPELSCKYETRFYLDDPTDLFLVMEPESIMGDYYFMVNGSKLTAADFSVKEFYLKTNLFSDITSLTKQGENTIELYVSTIRTFDGLINPLYIFGDFGLEATSLEKTGNLWHITKTPDTALISDITRFPFYAGDIEYITTMKLEKMSDLKLTLPWHKSLAAAKLTVNGKEQGVRAFTPFEWRIDESAILDGENEVSLTLSTTLLGLFEGQSIDKLTHEVIDYGKSL